MTVPAHGALELKICGTASPRDARLLHDPAVDYCGILVNVGFSPRSVSLAQAGAIAAATAQRVVVLLCNPTLDFCCRVVEAIRPFAIQLLCAEAPALAACIRQRLEVECWKSLHLPWLADQARPEAYVEAGIDRLLFDAQIRDRGQIRYGGTGQTADWALVRDQIRRFPHIPCFLAGGLHAGNIRQAVAATRPAGVDLCSGVEKAPGHRDPARLARLLRQWHSLGQGMEPDT